MFLPSPILADALGLVLGFIFLLLFALAGVSSMQRKREAEHRKRIRQELEHQGAPPPMPRPVRRSTPRREASPDWPILRDITPPSSQPTRTPSPAPAKRAQQVKHPAMGKHPSQRAASASPPAVPLKRKVRKAAPAPAEQTAAPLIAAQLAKRPSRHTTAEISAAPKSRRSTGTPTATAPALAKWLTATTMQSQFILTEILQPPLALREDNSR